jgi:hypothetical protein
VAHVHLVSHRIFFRNFNFCRKNSWLCRNFFLLSNLPIVNFRRAKGGEFGCRIFSRSFWYIVRIFPTSYATRKSIWRFHDFFEKYIEIHVFQFSLQVYHLI